MARMTEADADAYRQPMLDALGRDDALEVQASEVAAWRELIDRAGADIRTRPSER